MELDKLISPLLPLLTDPHSAVVVICLTALVVVGLALTKIPRP